MTSFIITVLLIVAVMAIDWYQPEFAPLAALMALSPRSIYSHYGGEHG